MGSMEKCWRRCGGWEEVRGSVGGGVRKVSGECGGGEGRCGKRCEGSRKV